MFLYILTRHENYYPEPGANDWQDVFSDPRVARLAYDTLDVRSGQYACLIRVSDKGWMLMDSRSGSGS